MEKMGLRQTLKEVIKEIGFVEERQGRIVVLLKVGDVNEFKICEEVREIGVLNFCSFSEGFVKIRLEYMNDFYIFLNVVFQLLRYSCCDWIVLFYLMKRKDFIYIEE